MRKTRHWLMTIAVLFCSLTTNAYDFEVGGIYYNITSDTDMTVEVTFNSVGQYNGIVTIPSIVDYDGKIYSVTAIGNNAFSEYNKENKLIGVNMPESITSIETWAFYSCKKLTRITIPKNVTSIGSSAFYACTSLKKVINCSNLKISGKTTDNGYVSYYVYDSDIVQGKEVTVVGDYQFITTNGSHHLIGYVGNNTESISLPDKFNGENYSIDSYALYGPAYKSVTVGSGVLAIKSDVYSSKPTKVFWLTNTPPSNWSNGSGTVNYSSNSEISSASNTYSYLSSMFEVDGVKYVMLSPKERTCVAIDCAYNSTAENIAIGKTVTNKNISFTVTEIKPYALYNNDHIKGVSIEHNGDIGKYAFYSCKSIQKIEVANQGSIDKEAFAFCTAEEINVSNGGDIADYAFDSCRGMKIMNISNQGTIGKYAFANGEGEQTIVTVSNAGNIGQEAFVDYKGMKSVDISNTGEVGQAAFKNCIDLQTAKIENIGMIGHEAFKNCCSLATAFLGENVTILGNSAFYGCTTLPSIVVPNTVQTVGSHCFGGCTALENAFIGTGVTKTEDYTFSECTNLKHIEIGKNVIEIGKNAFYDCKSLLEVNLPEGTKTIKESAFENCEAIAEINIPQATETIDKNVFKGCKNLSDVIIKDRTTALNLSYHSGTSSTNNPLFRDCPLDSVYIGGKIVYSTTKANGYSPFYNNKTLRTVVIANGEDNIYEYEFAYCSNLQHISIGNDVTAIGTYAFAGCTSLPTITIPSSTTKINDYAFYKCSKLADVIIADRTGTIYLGHNGASPMFVDCPLDSVYIGGKITYSTVETNGYSPFYRNTSLRTVHVTHNEVTIYENEFYGCTGLKSVSIGNGVTSIGDYAFSGCSALISFSFGKSMETIGKEAFSDCTSMVDLTSCATVPPTCGDQALADINVWDCILHVPSGCADAYYDADQWDGFFFIEEDGIQTEYYTLTYMVDGKVYKAETYAAGATVTMLVPTKEGYVFSGWNNVITTMPNENVIVTGTFVQKEMVTQVIVTINQYGSGTYCSEYALDFSEVEDLKAYAATGYNTATGTVTLTRVMTSKPGMGLFLKGEPGEYTVPTLESTDDNSLNMLVGTLENTLINGCDGQYYNHRYTIKDGEESPMFHRVDDGYTISANEAYLQIPMVWMSAEAKSIALRFYDGDDEADSEEDGATDIENETIDNNQQQTIIYNLMGRKVTNPQEGEVYIVNGKKVIL